MTYAYNAHYVKSVLITGEAKMSDLEIIAMALILAGFFIGLSLIGLYAEKVQTDELRKSSKKPD